MNRIELGSTLKGAPEAIAKDLLTMRGVNEELAPWLRMTAPAAWEHKAISLWPQGQRLFRSTILFAGFLPIDSHCFMFEHIGPEGFREASSSLSNKVWLHQRIIRSAQLAGRPDGLSQPLTEVRDIVQWQSRLPWFGSSFKSLYLAIFKHRHRGLRKKYGVPD